MTNKLYSAASLEDIARMFDVQAMKAGDSADKGKFAKGRALSRREQIVWSAAADILRNTELRQQP